MTNPTTVAPSVRFQVGYDGPALAAGRMDVRVLAGAMASVAQLVDDATRTIYGTDRGIRIEVSGDFRRSSFSYEIVATAVEGLTPEQIKNVLEWLGLIAAPTGLTVFGVLRFLRGRKPKLTRQSDNEFKIEAGRDSRVVNLQVTQLVMNGVIRRDIEGVTQPLGEPGIDLLKTGESEATDRVEITRDERESFLAPPPAAETLHDGEAVTVLQVVSPNFRIGNKWQFAYPGEAPFYAPILDEEFVKRLQRREVSFAFGDLVRVRMRTIVVRTEIGGLSTTREIVEVLDIIPPTTQTELSLEPRS